METQNFFEDLYEKSLGVSYLYYSFNIFRQQYLQLYTTKEFF